VVQEHNLVSRSRGTAPIGAALALALCHATAALAAPAAAPAASPAASKYIAVGAFYDSPDSTRGVETGQGVNYGYAGPLGKRSVWELRLFTDTLETDVPGATDFYQYGAGIDAIRYFGNTTAGHPFALLGAGAVSNDVDPDTDDAVSAYGNVGIGWRSAPWRGWGLRHRLELRGLYDSFDSGQIDVLAGLVLEIGAERTKVVERVVEVEKVVEKEVIREVPSLATAADIDGDDDGIVDERDKCPDTVAGAQVEADGCVRREQVIVLPNIEFEFARAELTSSGRDELSKVLAFLKDQPEIRLEVWGHTDDKGQEAYNLRLSQQRAAAVAAFLVANGVQAARLQSAGFGETRPMADNGTEEGQARNRRVELHIRAARTVGSR
jgi:OmpA-OmpF porin, OOP family